MTKVRILMRGSKGKNLSIRWLNLSVKNPAAVGVRGGGVKNWLKVKPFLSKKT